MRAHPTSISRNCIPSSADSSSLCGANRMGTTPPGKDDKVCLLNTVYRPYDGPRAIPPTEQPTWAGVRLVAALVGGGMILSAFVLFLLLALFGPGSSPMILETPVIGGPPRVTTRCTTVTGLEDNGGLAFLGIPYARAPLGKLRWRRPQSLWTDEEWCRQQDSSGGIQAVNFSSACPQVVPYSRQFLGHEDCLYLNVWTPRKRVSGRRDVLVWIHGGFLQFGSGHWAGLRPSGRLAESLGAVVVSFNYRLHVLGFLAADLLMDRATNSCVNCGLWDQLAALAWVRDHIEDFGGDPKKVTVFGADAGAASILALMASQQARGLFHKAWLIGPTAIFNRSLAQVARHHRTLITHHSGCIDSACLRRLTPAQTIRAYLGKDDPSFRIRDQNDLPIQAIYPDQLIILDDEILFQSPQEAIESKNIMRIPVLIGTSAQAVNFWPGPEDLHSWTWWQYKKYVTTSLDSFGTLITKMALGLYNHTRSREAGESPEFLYSTMVADVRQTCPVTTLSRKLTGITKVYRYVFVGNLSQPVTLYDYNASYSFHMAELVAFFDQFSHHFDSSPTSGDLALRDGIQETVMKFVRSQNSLWPEDKVTLLGGKPWTRTTDHYHRLQCKFWNENSLDAYSWTS